MSEQTEANDRNAPNAPDEANAASEASAPDDADAQNEYPEIVILGRDTCEDTIRSRGRLHQLGIPYIYRNVELDPDADAWNRSFNGGDRVTPVILIGDPRSPSAILIEPSDEALEAAITAATAPG